VRFESTHVLRLEQGTQTIGGLPRGALRNEEEKLKEGENAGGVFKRLIIWQSRDFISQPVGGEGTKSLFTSFSKVVRSSDTHLLLKFTL
jgi:hypothetical protein